MQVAALGLRGREGGTGRETDGLGEGATVSAFFLTSETFFSSVIDGMVGNFHELHQLQELVEHLLRSSQKKGVVEPIFGGVEWS